MDSKDDPVGIASKVFNNEDFGYHKVMVERPDRRKAQFSRDRLNALRFDKSLNEVMEHCFAEYGEQVYQDGFLTEHSKQILEWCEKNEISLNNKAKEAAKHRFLVRCPHSVRYGSYPDAGDR